MFALVPGETVPMTAGETHRAASPGVDDSVFILAQAGSPLSEDDIERLNDDYGWNAARYTLRRVWPPRADATGSILPLTLLHLRA